jgi:diadenosine tetraphosphate (Ap4A) HIT family hydrolase
MPGWRVAHDFNTSLPGWLILVPTRHVESLDELTAEEADTLGLLLRQASIVLKTVTGCRKTYVMMFAEKPGFTHVHFHVVPRMDDFPEDRVGPGVFGYLRETPMAEDRRDELATEIRSAWPSDSTALPDRAHPSDRCTGVPQGIPLRQAERSKPRA